MKYCEEYLKEGVNDKAVLKAIFVVGPPGSGKTFLGKKITESFGFKHISSDKLFEFMMKQDGTSLDMTRGTNSAEDRYVNDLRRFARQMMYREKDIYLKGRLGLLIDTPGYGEYVLKDKSKLEYLGYDTMMIFVRTPLQTSLQRNTSRERKVPSNVVATMHKSVMDVLPTYIKAFGKNLTIVDNENFDEVRDEMLWKKVRDFVNAPIKNRRAAWWLKKNSKTA